MRLYLSIQRHSLPIVNLIWKAPTELTTVAQLLEQVHEIIPLESEGWGIEDYVVSIDNFECLHFQNIHDVFHSEDHVKSVFLVQPAGNVQLTKSIALRHCVVPK